ncbi:MAG: hypothetical protein HZA52_03800 [Planctomycetes bacterium]|nr:hypothetical protein [Planctomycetota bacterium]
MPFARALCAVALSTALAACDSSEPSAPAAAVGSLDPASDPRLAPLFAPSDRDGHYDVDTSDPIAILEETLLRGQLDPLRRARLELAQAGEPGLAVARRILDAHGDDPMLEGWVRNALDVVSLSKEPGAHELVVRTLESPREELRAIALRMLRRRGTPEAPEPGQGRAEDFDLVLVALDRAGATTIRECALVLHDLDPVRAEAQYVEWMQRGLLRELWPEFAPYLAAATAPATVEACRALQREAPPLVRPYLAVAAARAGDSESREFLRAERTSDAPERRTLAIAALTAGRMLDELEAVLATETNCELRAMALREFALAPDEPRTRGVLHQATADACDELRFVALDALVARRDERAYDRALATLDTANALDLTVTMRALRRSLSGDLAFAERVLDRLLARHEREAAQPAGERAQLLQSIGQVPLERAARFLLERARVETDRIQTFEPHRWLCLQAANTGAAGTAVFLAELAGERDPRRRLDLLEGLAAPAVEGSRAALLELVQGDTLASHEIVYAAERLVTLGPVARVAPVLKRVTLRVEEPAARRALQALLWRSYPSQKRG